MAEFCDRRGAYSERSNLFEARIPKGLPLVYEEGEEVLQDTSSQISD